MRIVIFGATGMVGQGALRACLDDPGVSHVLAVGRTATGQSHTKLQDLVHPDIADCTPIADALAGHDACLFCLGVASAGMDEASYTRLTHDLTLAVAGVLVRNTPAMRFLYVSGAGADSTGQGRIMWARVRGRTENALLALPFRSVTIFRPGIIQPLHGIRSRTALYRAIYTLLGPVLTLLRHAMPAWVLTTDSLGRAMVAVARNGAAKPILASPDIAAIAAQP